MSVTVCDFCGLCHDHDERLLGCLSSPWLAVFNISITSVGRGWGKLVGANLTLKTSTFLSVHVSQNMNENSRALLFLERALDILLCPGSSNDPESVENTLRVDSIRSNTIPILTYFLNKINFKIILFYFFVKIIQFVFVKHELEGVLNCRAKKCGPTTQPPPPRRHQHMRNSLSQT